MLLKVMEKIQVHLHGVNMELMHNLNITMIIKKLVKIGVELKLERIGKTLEIPGLIMEELQLNQKLKP